MKTICLFVIGTLIAALCITVSTSHAWSGDGSPLVSESRAEILRLARQMVEFKWSPKATFTNLTRVSPASYSFTKDTIYSGETYTQDNPQQNWAEFYDDVSNDVSGGSYYLGNDCSGFVSISWKLPTRYTTSAFESDATSDGGYVTSLGAKSVGQPINGLLPGDALVVSGHIILFESYSADGRGIYALEQTPGWARSKYRTWSELSSYRPIRRNNIDEGNYVFQAKWGGSGTLAGQFDNPAGIAVDPSGNVYVADEYNDRIQAFYSSGGFKTSWGGTGTTDGKLHGPFGLATDGAGNVYVADSMNYRIQKYDGSGVYKGKWGQGLNGIWFISPHGIAIDSSDNIFVAETYGDTISRISSGGSVSTWINDVTGQFSSPMGVAVDRLGYVYVADTYNHRIQKFNNSAVFMNSLGTAGTGVGQFYNPVGLSVDPSGNLYVADSGNNRIQKFNVGGGFIAIGSAGMDDGHLNSPLGVAVDSGLNVYVADSGNDRIQKFAPVSPYPARPSHLAANSISSTQIRLDWADNSNNESGFNIVRKTGLRGNYEVIAQDVPANTTTFTDTVPDPGTYFYSVYARNGGLYSAYSEEAYATVRTQTAAIMDVPTGIFEYAYDLVADPVLNQDPSASKPSAFANTIAGLSRVEALSSLAVNEPYYGTGITDGTLTFRIAFLPFSAPVDIYVGVYAPAIDPNAYWYNSDNVGQPNITGIAAIWRENTIGPIDEVIFADLPVSSIPPAPYFIYTGVVPAGDTSFSTYYLWETSFEVRPKCTDLPTMIPRSAWAYFSTLQSAFDGVLDGETIQSEARDFYENPDFNRNVSAALKGGYYCGYTMSPSHSVIKGTLTISNGTVAIENIVLQ